MNSVLDLGGNSVRGNSECIEIEWFTPPPITLSSRVWLVRYSFLNNKFLTKWISQKIWSFFSPISVDPFILTLTTELRALLPVDIFACLSACVWLFGLLLIEWLMDGWIEWLIDWLIVYLLVSLFDWLADWLTWLIHWLIDWMIDQLIDRPIEYNFFVCYYAWQLWFFSRRWYSKKRQNPGFQCIHRNKTEKEEIAGRMTYGSWQIVGYRSTQTPSTVWSNRQTGWLTDTFSTSHWEFFSIFKERFCMGLTKKLIWNAKT